MADNLATLRFIIHCAECGQRLSLVSADEQIQIYGHDNPADCPQQAVETPTVTVEDLRKLFKPKPKATAKKSKK